MSNQVIEQAQIVTGVTDLDPVRRATQLALFDAEGNPITLGTASVATEATAGLVKQVSPVADVEEEDGEDDLVNELKAVVNDLLAKLRDAGVLGEIA